ncbi:hypothetical protein E2562_029115 [Oryza meyeriana var. granulata]|uniref:Uncharacterized protein n=1 Tax=Oryza meyeriana var. granulata TaxID=110450 RepID=A0A6G1EBQ5_9ORYZ|nr:hypothetical protein E2562_029115 [Oryza meyeriana var. granulata]
MWLRCPSATQIEDSPAAVAQIEASPTAAVVAGTQIESGGRRRELSRSQRWGGDKATAVADADAF